MVKYQNYIISEDCGKIRIQNADTGAEKTVKVTTDKCCDFVFKCLKAQIKTQFTAQELLDWMQSLIDKDFCTPYISAICRQYVV